MQKKPKKNLTNPQFRILRWRLLLSYLSVMLAIWLISDGLVYQFFARSLYQQLDNRLVNLAQAASHSLVAIKKNPNAITHPPDRSLDKDGDLDIPWQNLRRPRQSIEWFGENQQPLAYSGNLATTWPLKIGFQTVENGQIRTLVIATYSDNQGQKQLEGYIRASESTAAIEAILARLRWESTLGAILALVLIGVGGMWLTQQSLKPVEQSFLQLKQFTADASHELRSPLTAIKTAVEVIQTHSDRVPHEDIPKLEIILSATEQMSYLVEDLLLLARMDGKQPILSQQWQTIPLTELLEDVVEFLEPKAEAKQIILTLYLLSEVSVKGDGHKLLRVFSNLVENALEYTPAKGKVTVCLKQIDKLAIVTVEDTGIGIATENLPYIFDRLWRAELARTYRPQGSGLGLAIVQTLVQHHGGEITVKSQLGVGSCFKVSLLAVK